MTELSSEQLANLIEFGEADAWANFFLCTPPEFAREYKVEAKRVGSVWVTMIPGMDSAFFNRIVGLGVREPTVESLLDEAINILQDAGCKNYMAQLCPSAQPSSLPEWLSARGFTKGRNWAKVYRGNEPAPTSSTNLRVEQIGAESASIFADVVQAAFGGSSELHPMFAGFVGKPGWHHYLAFDGDQPVSAAVLNVSGETGWLGIAGTLESHRRRGGQGALFARRIADGLKLGCKWFVTETGEDSPEAPNPSYHNMLRAGFKLAYLRPNYVHQPPTGN